MKPKIYLAGAIEGLTHTAAASWREYVAEKLGDEFAVLSPLRGKKRSALQSDRAILARDFYDVRRSDLIFVYLGNTTSISIGTSMEVAYATAFRVPVLRVDEFSSNLHRHPMLDQCVDFWADTLDEGIELARRILLPD